MSWAGCAEVSGALRTDSLTCQRQEDSPLPHPQALSLATAQRDVPPHITPSLSEDPTQDLPRSCPDFVVPSWSQSNILQAPTGHKDLTPGSMVLGGSGVLGGFLIDQGDIIGRIQVPLWIHWPRSTVPSVRHRSWFPLWIFSQQHIGLHLPG